MDADPTPHSPHATARALRSVENRAFHAFIYAFSKPGIRVLTELGPHEVLNVNITMDLRYLPDLY
jgi:hypothetical protein